jgi:hypothetical protein
MMLKLFGANPGVAALVGIGLLIFGITSDRYVLAAAGALVLVGSAARLVTARRDHAAGGKRVESRGDGGRGPGAQR